MHPPAHFTPYTTTLRTAFLRLSRSYHQATGDAACFYYTPSFEPQPQPGQEEGVAPLWLRAVEVVLDVIQVCVMFFFTSFWRSCGRCVLR